MQLSVEDIDIPTTENNISPNETHVDRDRNILDSVSVLCNSLSARCPDTNSLRESFNACSIHMPDCSSMFILSYNSLYERLPSFNENRCFNSISEEVSRISSNTSQGLVSLRDTFSRCGNLDNDTKQKIYAGICVIILLALGLGLGLGLSKIECKTVYIKNKSGYTLYFDNGLKLYNGYSHNFKTPATGTKVEKFDWGFFAPYECDLKLKRKGVHADITNCIKPNAFSDGICTYSVEDKTSFSSNNLRHNKQRP